MRLLLPALIVIAAALGGCAHPNVRSLEAFREAEARKDLAAAMSYMSADPRQWWEQKEGPGELWTLEGGRWAEWDGHFRGRSEHGRWDVRDGGREVSAAFTEVNDYYLLTERGPQHHRQTYYFDQAGKIGGLLVSDEPEPAGAPTGRGKEFWAWVVANHPEEAEYLRPGGGIDPTRDRAERTRRLLEAWRASVGLAPLPASDD